MCQMVGLTPDPRAARQIGMALAATDYAGVVNVLAASTTSQQRSAAAVNAGLDVMLASVLLALGLRRVGSQRMVSIVVSASVWLGVGAWLLGARAVEDVPPERP